jgi:hypothetical protein
VQDQRHQVLVRRQFSQQPGGQLRPGAQERLFAPGGADHDQAPLVDVIVTEAEPPTVPGAVSAAGDQPIEAEVPDHYGPTSRAGAGLFELGNLPVV